mmetsp:Transcript_11461/g.38272  ORF Transcript_11461/g.38272 Transcript_11461/m.38272 type:complete len:263 (-) Transcript_11461:664-1452(-)
MPDLPVAGGPTTAKTLGAAPPHLDPPPAAERTPTRRRRGPQRAGHAVSSFWRASARASWPMAQYGFSNRRGAAWIFSRWHVSLACFCAASRSLRIFAGSAPRPNENKKALFRAIFSSRPSAYAPASSSPPAPAQGSIDARCKARRCDSCAATSADRGPAPSSSLASLPLPLSLASSSPSSSSGASDSASQPASSAASSAVVRDVLWRYAAAASPGIPAASVSRTAAKRARDAAPAGPHEAPRRFSTSFSGASPRLLRFSPPS